MRTAPKEFTDRLARAFDGRLRIRWSLKRREWHIEQQVGRATLPPIFIDPGDDDLIRAKDGYAYVMTVREGDRMPCPHPECHWELKVPVMRYAEATCDYCRSRGRNGRYPAAYFPLSDALIEHLRKISPERASRTLTKMLDARNQAILAANERDIFNDVEASTKENWTRMTGIQSVGYTGKEFRAA